MSLLSVRRPRLADVALLANVAVSTASRALTQPDRVSAETRDRVHVAARKLGYHSPHATEVRRGTVATLVADITNPFYFDFIRGAQSALSESGYSMVVADTEDSGLGELSTARRLTDVVDGFIFGASRLSDGFLRHLCERTPAVALNRSLSGITSVIIDPAPGIDAAVEHLSQIGHREVFYAAGPRNSASEPPRWRAVRDACASRGIRIDRRGPFAPRQTDGGRVAQELLSSRATACIAFNDLLAIGTIRALRARRVRVPEDLSVIGCDDIFGADFCDPPLSTITSSMASAGATAARLLITQLDCATPFDGQESTTTLSTGFVSRGSTAAPAGADDYPPTHGRDFLRRREASPDAR